MQEQKRSSASAPTPAQTPKKMQVQLKKPQRFFNMYAGTNTWEISPDAQWLLRNGFVLRGEAQTPVPTICLHQMSTGDCVKTQDALGPIKNIYYISEQLFIYRFEHEKEDRVELFRIRAKTSWCCDSFRIEQCGEQRLKMSSTSKLAVIGKNTIAIWQNPSIDLGREHKDTPVIDIRIFQYASDRNVFDMLRGIKIEALSIEQILLDENRRCVVLATDPKNQKKLFYQVEGSAQEIPIDVHDCIKFCFFQNLLVGYNENEKKLFAFEVGTWKPISILADLTIHEDGNLSFENLENQYLIVSDSKNVYFFQKEEQDLKLQRGLGLTLVKNTHGIRSKLAGKQLFITYLQSSDQGQEASEAFYVTPCVCELIPEKTAVPADRKGGVADIDSQLQARRPSVELIVSQRDADVAAPPSSMRGSYPTAYAPLADADKSEFPDAVDEKEPAQQQTRMTGQYQRIV